MTAVTLKKSEVKNFRQDLRFSLYSQFTAHGVDELLVVLAMNSNCVYFKRTVPAVTQATSMPIRDELMQFIKFKAALGKIAANADACETAGRECC